MSVLTDIKELVDSLNISEFHYINALIIFLAFVVAAKVIDVFIDKLLRKFTDFTKTDLDDRIIDIIHSPTFKSIVLVGIIFAVRSTGISDRGAFYTDSSILTLIVIIWSITAARISFAVIEHRLTLEREKDTTGLLGDILPLVENVTKVVIFAGAVMAVLSVWNISITPLLASAGIAGVGIAIAAKDTISNFFGGISVFMDKPYKIGDYIVLDKGERGEVVNIGLRSTRIKTRDDIMITVPNAVIANTKIINESAPFPKFRVRVPFSVAYGSDIDLVERAVLEVAAKNSNVVAEPEPRVRFREFGDSALLYDLLCWAEDPSLRGLTIHELNCGIYKKFAEVGITIPFPQRDVHMRK